MQIPNFSDLSILVIGDIMLDSYWQGSTKRISPEAPVPVVNKQHTEHRLGGAANVANNLASLNVKTQLHGIIGADEQASQIKALLSKSNIESKCIESDNSQTITKLRLISQNQQLVRIDSESPFDDESKNHIINSVLTSLTDLDAIIVSDYGKGTLENPQPVIKAANALQIPIVIDPKGDDYTKYTGATAITPNLKEFETIVGTCSSDEELFIKGEELRSELKLNTLLITLSERGVAIISEDLTPVRIPTRAREVYDVTGAGDTVIALIAAGLGAKLPISEAVALGNLGGGVVVGKLGTSSVTQEELLLAAATEDDVDHHIISSQQLPILVKAMKSQGKRIVMTNGCFDILHPGHVRYLQQAAALGDLLIIAVNDDASVARLKGPSRPINTLSSRMQMLASIKGVSWVVSFSEDTPIEVIKTVLPDILVKGGDYVAEALVGYKEVTENNGEVRILPFKDGFSTTQIIEKIRSLQDS